MKSSKCSNKNPRIAQAWQHVCIPSPQVAKTGRHDFVANLSNIAKLSPESTSTAGTNSYNIASGLWWGHCSTLITDICLVLGFIAAHRMGLKYNLSLNTLVCTAEAWLFLSTSEQECWDSQKQQVSSAVYLLDKTRHVVVLPFSYRPIPHLE